MNESQVEQHDDWKPHYGESHPMAKLKEEDVREIRRRHANGRLKSELSRDFGVSVQTITLVVERKSWKHVR